MKIKNPLYIKLGLSFFVVGLAGLIFPFVSFGLSEEYTLLQEIANQKQEQSYQDQFLSESSGGLESSTNPAPDLNLVNVSNRLVMPSIGVDMPIFASDNPNTLLKGGWAFPGTATPGQKGNSVIFAHRFRYLPPITNTFYSLDKIQIGDTFTVAWDGVAYTYQVKEKKIIEPTDFSVLDQGSEYEMTLITCAPLFSIKQRLVVIGTLIK